MKTYRCPGGANRRENPEPRGWGKALLACLTLLLPESALKAATVEYDLTIANQEMDFTGRPVEAMTIIGQLPGPILRFTEGDRAVIRVHNRMKVETSIQSRTTEPIS